MKRRLLQFLIVIGAAAVGAVVGTVAFSDGDLSANVSARIARAQLAVERTGEGGAKNGKVHSDQTNELVRSRWIASVKPKPYCAQPVRVADVRSDGSLVAGEIDRQKARSGFGATIRNAALRQWGKAPKEERYAKLTHSSSSSEEEKCPVYPGDVFLSGIPMIDQGPRSYCAVASAARVLQSYGIEVTMDDMANLANASETGGTNISRWDQAIRQVAAAHGLELTAIPELTDIKKSLVCLVDEYNGMAREMGYDELDAYSYVRPFYRDYKSFVQDREYPVQREIMLSDDCRRDAFDANVTGRIDDSDPIFWSVTLGDIPEQTAYGKGMYKNDERGSHMRLIIGYNEERGEVLYSDSWGDGHELKRMDACDALSITKGMYYLTDKVESK